MNATTLFYSIVGILCVLCLVSSQPAGSAIRFIDHSYRKYVGKRGAKHHPWKDSFDMFTKRGYIMVPVLGQVSDQPVTEINTMLGPVNLTTQTPFVLQDFYAAYGIPTIWPYCASTRKCLVYSQQQSPQYNEPVTLQLPAQVSAVDFYIDAAIDCVTTMRALVSCRLLVQPGAIEVKVKVSSICASPCVGKYVGFLDEEGRHIESVTIQCKSTYPNALGLIRIGQKGQQLPPLITPGLDLARAYLERNIT